MTANAGFFARISTDFTLWKEGYDEDPDLAQHRIFSVAFRVAGLALGIVAIGMMFIGISTAAASASGALFSLVSSAVYFVFAHDLIVFGQNKSQAVGLTNPLQPGWVAGERDPFNRIRAGASLVYRGGPAFELQGTWVTGPVYKLLNP